MTPSGRGPRVVSGSAGGLRLAVPRGLAVRPTSDRVKESVFSALGPGRLVDAVVLDCYAGTGALAIEALSRGAGRAVLVESDPAAARAIEANLETTRLAPLARVHRGDVGRFLVGDTPPEAPFDLVFLDPPYDDGPERLAPVLAALADRRWTARGATLVVEGGVRQSLAEPPGAHLVWRRGYGGTVVWFFTTGEEGE